MTDAMRSFMYVSVLASLALACSCRTTEPRAEIGAGWPALLPSPTRETGRQALARLRGELGSANIADRREIAETEAKFSHGDQAKIDALRERISSRIREFILSCDAFFNEHPDDWQEMDLAADFFFEQKFDEEALRYWEKAVRIKPNSAPIRNNITVVCSHNGRISDAVDHLRTAIELDPEEPEYHFNLATVYSTARFEIQKREHWTLPEIFWKSQAEYERARTLAPDSYDYASNCFLNYVMARYFQVENIDEIELAATERCLEIRNLTDAQKSFVLTHLGRICMRAGRKAEARRWLEEAMTIDNCPGAMNLLRQIDDEVPRK